MSHRRPKVDFTAVEHAAACGSKPGYSTKTLARAGGRRSLERYGGRPLWVYQCPRCQLWHLTKQPQGAPSASVNYEPKR